jgi:glyoxylase-like metal-dependent hydrolase (beta-lactamase superfamily II)
MSLQQTHGAARGRPPRVVPPPSAVGPDVWSIPLPFPNPLAYVLCYCVRVKRGVVLVDLGWDSDEAWDALQLGLRRAGAGLGDVVGAVLTHLHPDHHGLVERLRRTTGAWIAAHPAELPHVAPDEQARDQYLEQMAGWLRRCGCPPSELAALASSAAEVKSRLALAAPDVHLTDGAVVPETEGQLVTLHTPGHTPGHLCLLDMSRRLVFTGDHVLPRVTPNVSWRPDVDPDPLADFVSSLERLRPYATDYLALPGHEWAFDRLGRRLDELLEHHRDRLDEVQSAVMAGASTTWDVARSIKWRRPFETLEPRARRSALGETGSHLIRLANAGRISCDQDTLPGWPGGWRRTAGSASGRSFDDQQEI